ncbi:F-actin-capping protein subunit beta [[Candida] jaroonii]|uniref:F-actin-capping protein subunit beta n=1 Tax=[Candida] jaroonii TaxID=467808 RepID=A0ACA9Y5Z7_9ASCO|nr:F-actin-capping protein subunit beta [[Candida] jaroonii]
MDKFDSSLDLLRRLNPDKISENLNDLCTILQNDDEIELTQDLLSSIDTPLKLIKDSSNNKEFLCCDYNRDGDNYRSPWTNKYFPENEVDDETPFPSSTLRKLEIKANESFDIYRDLYYENSGVSSVYLWDTEDDETLDGFAGVVLFKKEIDGGEGKWDSIHVFEVIKSGSNYNYKLTTSVILNLSNKKLSCSGNLTRQFESTKKFTNDTNLETFHLINLGQLIENSEYNIRNLLQEVYFDKLKDIILKDLRNYGNDSNELNEKQQELIKGLQGL